MKHVKQLDTVVDDVTATQRSWTNNTSVLLSVVQTPSVGEPRSHSDLVQERPRGPVSCGPQRTLGGESQVKEREEALLHPSVCLHRAYTLTWFL